MTTPGKRFQTARELHRPLSELRGRLLYSLPVHQSDDG